MSQISYSEIGRRRSLPADIAQQEIDALILRCATGRETSLSLRGYSTINSLAFLSDFEWLEELDCAHTSVTDLGPLAGLTALQNLDCGATEISDLGPLAGHKALQILDCSYTSVTDLEPLRRLYSLRHLDVSFTQVYDLSPVRSLPQLIHIRQIGIAAYHRQGAKAGAVSQDTIKQSITRNLGLDADQRSEQSDKEKLKLQESARRASQLRQTPGGATFAPAGDFLAMTEMGDDSDLAAARGPMTQQMQSVLRIKALDFSVLAKRLDNQIGWTGIGTVTETLANLLNRKPEDVPEVLGFLYPAAIELGSFVELDDKLASNADSTAMPLDPEVRRPLSDLVRNLAPWLRSFPSVRQADDEANRFLVQVGALGPTFEVVDSARDHQLLPEADLNVFYALRKASNRGAYLGEKAGGRAQRSAKNLVVQSVSILAAFFSGAVSSDYAMTSPLVKKVGQFLVSTEISITKLVADLPHDLRYAVTEFVKDIPKDHVTLPHNPKVQDQWSTKLPTNTRKWYISCAWDDDTAEGKEHATKIIALCQGAEVHGIKIVRDRGTIGESNSFRYFMESLVEGDRLIVILSEKYFQSTDCMFELYHAWQKQQADPHLFVKAMRVYRLPTAKIAEASERAAIAKFWADKVQKLKPYADALGSLDLADYLMIQQFALNVGDILYAINDRISPRDWDEFVDWTFAD